MSDGEKSIQLTETELKALLSSTVLDTLTKLGIDHIDPLETQKDMAHLRNWRRSTEAVKRKGVVTSVGFIIVSILGMAFKVFFGD